jgi:hypothetical protein
MYKIPNMEDVYKNSTLVARYSASHAVTNNYKGRKLFILDHEMCSLSDKFDLENSYVALPTAGGVSSLATSFAYFIGGNPIVFIGHDFNIDNGVYCEGYRVNNDEDEINRIKEAGLVPDATNIGFNKIDYKEAKRFIETLILLALPDRKFISASETGASLAGADNMTLSEVAKVYFNSSFTVSVPKSPQYNDTTDILLSKLKRYLLNLQNEIRKFRRKIDHNNVSLDEKVIKIDTWFDKMSNLPGYKFFSSYFDISWQIADAKGGLNEKLQLLDLMQSTLSKSIAIIDEEINYKE